MKLSNEETLRVIAMYPYAPFLLYITPFNNPVINDMGIGYKSIHSVEPDLKNKKDLLLLTPLEKITDEDAVQVAKMEYPNEEHGLWRSDVGFRVCEGMGYYPEGVVKISVYQFLVSKFYAVPIWFGVNHPANGKTAIELGIAIDKTTIET